MLTEGWCVMDKHSMMLSSTKAKCSKHGKSKQPGVQLLQQQHISLALAMRIPVRHEKVIKQRWHQHPPPHPLVPVVQRLLLCRTLKYLSLKKASAELHHKLRGEQAGLCCSANIPQLCTAESGKSLSQLILHVTQQAAVHLMEQTTQGQDTSGVLHHRQRCLRIVRASTAVTWCGPEAL